MTLEMLVSAAIGLLAAAGIYLVLRARTFPVVLGLTLLSFAINLFLFASGRLLVDSPPLYDKAAESYTDPLPQALVLTAIVIAFGTTALLVALSLRAFIDIGSDHVDGKAPSEEPPP